MSRRLGVDVFGGSLDVKLCNLDPSSHCIIHVQVLDIMMSMWRTRPWLLLKGVLNIS